MKKRAQNNNNCTMNYLYGSGTCFQCVKWIHFNRKNFLFSFFPSTKYIFEFYSTLFMIYSVVKLHFLHMHGLHRVVYTYIYIYVYLLRTSIYRHTQNTQKNIICSFRQIFVVLCVSASKCIDCNMHEWSSQCYFINRRAQSIKTKLKFLSRFALIYVRRSDKQ